MRLLAIDSDNLLHRGFHAIPPMTAPDGTPNNALRGFCNGISRLLQEIKPDLVICAFDGGIPTWRKQAKPEYKANRGEKVEELRIQLDTARLILCPAMGFHVAWAKDIEADDQIYTICQEASQREDEIHIASGDKDLAQCLSFERTTLWRPKTAGGWARWRTDEVKAEWGVKPEQIAELLALTGDSADNLSGIPGVGPKTAAKWLNQYGNLEEIKKASTNGELAPFRLAKNLDPDLLAANLLVTKAHNTGYKPPSEPKREVALTETLRTLGLYKVAQNWRKTNPQDQLQLW